MNTPPPSKWSKLYSADHARWNDAWRTFSFIIGLILALSASTIYIVFYLYVNSGQWFDSASAIQAHIMPIKVLLALVLPLLIMLVGLNIVLEAVGTFFNTFYKPPEEANRRKLIIQRLLGILPMPSPLSMFWHYPFAIINIKDIDNKKYILGDKSIHWLGGPATLVIFDGTGVYVERGNHFSRTLGPGIVFLERFERVREIIDLRPQTVCSGKPNMPPAITGRTKDGIKIKLNVEIKFHIIRPDPKKNPDSKNQQDEDEARKLLDTPAPVFSGDLSAIKKAIERTAVRYRQNSYLEASWIDGVWGTVSGSLALFINQHFLDELLVLESPNNHHFPAHVIGAPLEATTLQGDGKPGTLRAGQLLSGQMREKFRQEMDAALRDNFGVTLTDLRVVDFDIHPKIYEQYIRMVSAEVESRRKRVEGTTAVQQIQIREEVRARAQQDLIVEIADAFGDIDPKNFTDSVLLSLSSILDQSLEDTAIPSMLARDNLAILEELRNFLKKNDN